MHWWLIRPTHLFQVYFYLWKYYITWWWERARLNVYLWRSLYMLLLKEFADSWNLDPNYFQKLHATHEHRGPEILILIQSGIGRLYIGYVVLAIRGRTVRPSITTYFFCFKKIYIFFLLKVSATSHGQLCDCFFSLSHLHFFPSRWMYIKTGWWWEESFIFDLFFWGEVLVWSVYARSSFQLAFACEWRTLSP